MLHSDLRDARCSDGEVECVPHVGVCHARRQLPRENEVREVINDGG